MQAQGDPFFKVLTGYRYLSWLITSGLYLMTFATGGRPSGFQLGVTASLLLAAVVTHGLHRAYWGQPQALVPILLFESAATLALLWPTGGLDSVFIWYAINPILAAASSLSLRWSLGLAAGILAAASAMVAVPLGTVTGWDVRAPVFPDLAQAFPWGDSRLYTALIFVLVTVGVQVLAALSRTVYRQNLELGRKSLQLQRALHVREALYELIERLSEVVDEPQVAAAVTSACRRLVGAERLEVCMGGQALEGQASAGGPAPSIRVDLAAPGRVYGCIDAYYGPCADPFQLAQDRAALERVAELAAAALERLRLAELNRQLSVAAEKQRIADELHDSVAQQLFNISTSCYALQHGWRDLPADEVSRRLAAVGRAASVAARSLRQSIYGLVPQQEAVPAFSESVRRYAADIAQVHGVKVTCRVPGEVDAAKAHVSRALWRVLQEAVGNALVHSGCSAIQIRLSAHRGGWTLLVADDGRGLPQGEQPVAAGRGLASMAAVARKAGGRLRLWSRPGRGTVVACRIAAADRARAAGKRARILNGVEAAAW